jgi:hypothetical protein
VTVLLFFRERESFAQSLYAEVCAKAYWQGPFEQFVKSYAPWFEYDRQISLFREAFENVEIASYEDARRSGLIKTFFSIIGFQMPPWSESVWKRRTENPPQLRPNTRQQYRPHRIHA